MKDEADNKTLGWVGSRWISVKDGLPDDNHGRVLVWVAEQGSLGKSGYFWNCGYSDKTGFIDGFTEYNVTHWMPSPEPPK